MTPPRSLALFGRPNKNVVRAAVAKCIRDVKCKHNLSNARLAELLGCSDATISNAENEACTLDLVTMLNIGYVFGEAAVGPVRAVMFGETVQEKTETDILDEVHALLNQLRTVKMRAVA